MKNPAEILKSEGRGEAYQAAIDTMVQALQEMIGEEISTARLMNEVFGDYNDRSVYYELFDVDNDVRKAAEEAGLILDMSKHENKVEGLPFNLDYKILRKG